MAEKMRLRVRAKHGSRPMFCVQMEKAFTENALTRVIILDGNEVYVNSDQETFDKLMEERRRGLVELIESWQ